MAEVFNLTGKVRVTGSAILCFTGPPNRAIEWQMIEGSGTLTAFSLMTDAYGRASCKFNAGGIVETIIVGVAFVP